MSASVASHPSGPAAGQRVRRLLRSDPVTGGCVGLVAAIALLAIFAPVIAPYAPDQVDLSVAYSGPSAAHPLGTDASGRDILSRLLYGARTSLLGPLCVIAVATTLGVLLALVAAWFGGWLNTVLAAAFDVLLSFPGLLLAIGAAAVFGTGLLAPVIALGIAYTPYVARVVRSVALRERRLPYVAAASVLGVSRRRIMLRHLLPNLWPMIVAQATLAFGYATIDLAAISFLGLGLQPPAADWGLTVANGRPAILAGQPAEALYPGVALIVVVLAVMVIGRRLARRTGAEL